MGDISLELWLHKYKMEALEVALENEGSSVEERMQEHLLELYSEMVPVEKQLAIRARIDMDDAVKMEQDETTQPIAAFHVTEGGRESWLQQKERTEFLHAAVHLRQYLTADPYKRAASFAATLSRADSITPERFRELALERMENTGRVTGAFDIDLDKGEFSALHIMDGWKTYRVQDVSVAAYRAAQKSWSADERRWKLFLDRLEGRELTAGAPNLIEVQGTRRLLPDDITFEGSIEEMDAALLDAEATDIRSTDMGLELTLGGVRPEELDRFYEDCESHQRAEEAMWMRP